MAFWILLDLTLCCTSSHAHENKKIRKRSIFLYQNPEKAALKWILEKFYYFRNAKWLNLTVGRRKWFFSSNISLVTFWPFLFEPHHPFLLNIFLRGKHSISKPAQSQGSTDGCCSCSSSDRLREPAGTLPPALSTHLVRGTTPPCSALCWVCHRTLAKTLQPEWVLLIAWKMGSPNTSTQITCFSWNDWQFPLKKNILTGCDQQKERERKKIPSEIVYSDSLQQGEWVKLLNRIHSVWLNWNQAKEILEIWEIVVTEPGREKRIHWEWTDHSADGK